MRPRLSFGLGRMLGIVLAALAVPDPVVAQLVLGSADASITLEAFANTSAGIPTQGDDTAVLLDGSLRMLGLTAIGETARIGVRTVVDLQAGTRSAAGFAERSLIWLDSWGRLEVGRRQGLPDVLVGYAPNNFTFTTAEFGPASGFSLDPGGGLPTLLIDAALIPQMAGLDTLGYAATFANDQSEKLIYVSPKWRGFLGGLSYAPDAESGGDRYDDLWQFGLTHERYVGAHILRYGGSYSHAVARQTRDLRSVNIGASGLIDDRWLVGFSAGYDSGGPDRLGGRGLAASLNYNRGPWTVGGFLQLAHSRGASSGSAVRRLAIGEIGVSYRSSPRLRSFVAYYHGRLNDSGSPSLSAGAVILGVRASI